MRRQSIKSLQSFEICGGSCPLESAGYDQAGTSVKHDVGILINRMKKIHPGIIMQNHNPPETAMELVEDDDKAVARFVAAAWHCVRIKQRHDCQNPSVTDVRVNSSIL